MPVIKFYLNVGIKLNVKTKFKYIFAQKLAGGNRVKYCLLGNK